MTVYKLIKELQKMNPRCKVVWMTHNPRRAGKLFNELSTLLNQMGYEGKIEVTCPEIQGLQSKLAIAREALEFYADKENWDDDQFNPTIWDDGDIDLGKRARQALEKIR